MRSREVAVSLIGRRLGAGGLVGYEGVEGWNDREKGGEGGGETSKMRRDMARSRAISERYESIVIAGGRGRSREIA